MMDEHRIEQLAGERLVQSRVHMRSFLRGEEANPGDLRVQAVKLAARHALGAAAEQHPLALVGGAALAGAVFVRVQPWRWLLRPALVAGVASQVTAHLIDKVSGPGLLQAVAAVLNQKDRP